MRTLACVTVFALGCGSDVNHKAPDLEQPADLAGVDEGPVDFAGGADFAQADAAAGKDAGPLSCAPTGKCQLGPECGDICCGVGERCDTTGAMPQCRCGQGPACDGGNQCASAGPQGQNQCGMICCGGTGGPPCPL